MPRRFGVEPNGEPYYLDFDDYPSFQGPARFRFRRRNPLRPLKRPGLALDPVCLAACASYAINRWGIEPHVSATWVHSWVNDMLLIPAALPVLFAVQQALGLRKHDGPPTWPEIGAHVAGWSLLFEGFGPMLNPRSTGDVWDVIAYSIGSIAAGFWWQSQRRRRAKRAE